MFKILHVTASMNPEKGGVCEAVRNIVAGMIDQSVHHEVVSVDDPADSFKKVDSFLIHPQGRAKTSWHYSPKLLPWLIENAQRFDAIIIHGLWLYPSFATFKALGRIRRNFPNSVHPRIFTMPHGMLDPYFQRAIHRKLKALRNLFYWHLIERRVVNESRGLLFTCDLERQLAAQPFPYYHPKKETVVGLGVEQPPVYISSMKNAFTNICTVTPGPKYLLFLGRIDPKKGIDILLEGFANAYGRKQSVPFENAATNMKLVIAGPGVDKLYIKKLHSIVEKYGISNQVLFPGMLSGDAKWGAIYGCEAFILPSHQENFGLAVVEALACSKPVLISDKVNICHEIKNETAGLVEADTADGTLRMLNHWKALNKAERQALSTNAIACYRKYFENKASALKLLNAIID